MNIEENRKKIAALFDKKEPLAKQRNVILDCWFLNWRPKKLTILAEIEAQIDTIDAEIYQLCNSDQMTFELQRQINWIQKRLESYLTPRDLESMHREQK